MRLFSLSNKIKVVQNVISEYVVLLLTLLYKGWAKKMSRFFGRLFWQASNVDFLETVCSNDLKFEVRIVLVDIAVESWPK